jgi:flagellar hook-associated protein FlgK
MRKEALAKQKENQGYIASANAEISTANAAARQLNRAERLLNSKAAGTGTLLKHLPTIWKTQEAQELQTIVNQMVLSEAEKMTGALSESDMLFLKNTTISEDWWGCWKLCSELGASRL